MKRIYACLCIVAVLLGVAFYSSWRVQKFAEDISDDIDNAMEAIRDEDLPSARQALAEGAELCDKMREGMNHLLRTQDFTELEAALRAADGHLELNAPEEAFGELRRAQVQVETLEWLSRRLVQLNHQDAVIFRVIYIIRNYIVSLQHEIGLIKRILSARLFETFIVLSLFYSAVILFVRDCH